MAEDSEDQSNKKPDNKDKSIPESFSNTEKEGEGIVNKHHKKTNFSEDSKTKSDYIPPITVVSQKEKGWTKEHIITLMGVLISASLFIITLLTFNQTKRSVNISATALEDARIKDSISNIRDSLRFERNDSNTKNALFLSNKSLESQINSIKETQQIFEKTNQPFLEMIDPEITTFKINNSIRIKCTIENLSNIPLKIIKQKNILGVGTYTPNIVSKVKAAIDSIPYTPLNFYITKEKAYVSNFGSKIILTKWDYDHITNGNYFIFTFREITYENLVTNKMRRYVIFAKFKPTKDTEAFPNGTHYDYIYNDNYDIK
jgi:hypothetical protein